jgi:hypothetical protein
MQRQLVAAKILSPGPEDAVARMPQRKCLAMIAAWLIINSMQTEQVRVVAIINAAYYAQ